MKDKIKFIVNPRSGEDKTADFLKQLKYCCNFFKLDFSISVTKDKHHGIELADDAIHHKFNTIVAVGGDGTLHEVLHGVVGKNVKLGVIPFGSSNDFARSINVQPDLKNAVEIIANGKCKLIDIGGINDKFFINISSLGFDGEVVARLPKMKSKYLFSVVYILGVFKEVFRYKRKRVRIIADDKDMGFFNVNSVAIANGKFYGHKMMIAPDAELDDGLFDVILIADYGSLRFLMNFPKVFKGAHIHEKDIVLFRCKRLVLYSDEKVYVESDGELTGTLPVEYRMFEKFQKVLVP